MGTGDVVKLTEYWPSVPEALGLILSTACARGGITACNPSSQEEEEGGTKGQGYHWLLTEFEVSLAHKRPCVKKQTKKQTNKHKEKEKGEKEGRKQAGACLSDQQRRQVQYPLWRGRSAALGVLLWADTERLCLGWAGLACIPSISLCSQPSLSWEIKSFN